MFRRQVSRRPPILLLSPSMIHLQTIFSLCLSGYALGQTYSATYLPTNAPFQSENGQSGTNRCGTGSNQTSQCQNAYINSIDDWCVWGPPNPGPGSVIGNTERIEVAWCTKSGTGTRLIPDGTIGGAHFVQTPDFVQITGVGNLTFINIPAGDAGGELDPHGADGNGNPIGGLVFSSAFTGQIEEIFEWTNYISDTQFCFRACKPGPQAPTWCQHIYDVMGCDWNMPANYNPGVFESCKGDSGEPMGVYGTSTFHQGDAVTPSAHPVPSSSSCNTISTIKNGLVQITTVTSSGTTITAATTVPTGSSQTPTTGSSTQSSSPTATGTNSAPVSAGISFPSLIAAVLGLALSQALVFGNWI